MEGTLIRLVAVAIVLAVATSAQAMSPAPLHQPDGMTTQARQARQLRAPRPPAVRALFRGESLSARAKKRLSPPHAAASTCRGTGC